MKNSYHLAIIREPRKKCADLSVSKKKASKIHRLLKKKFVAGAFVEKARLYRNFCPFHLLTPYNVLMFVGLIEAEEKRQRNRDKVITITNMNL
jgi:hypothetical protein